MTLSSGKERKLMKNRKLERANRFFVNKNMTVDGSSTFMDVKKEIRAIADNYGGFADDVFEAGATELAKKYLKEHGVQKKIKRIVTCIIGCFGIFIMLLGIVLIPYRQAIGLIMVFVGCSCSTVFTIKEAKDVRE